MAMAHHAIHEAAIDADAEALRRELDEGVSPNLEWGGLIPLHHLCARTNDKDADNLLACFNILVAAGANVNAVSLSKLTPLTVAAWRGHPALVVALVNAGANVNYDGSNAAWTPLHWACNRDTPSLTCVEVLLNAGAEVNARTRPAAAHLIGRTPLDNAILKDGQERIYPTLLRAGAITQIEGPTNAYLRRVIAAGGIKKYERAHLNAIAATFIPKLPLLPPEMVRRVVEYAFHVGDY
jgi:ankyrin repeat protein